MGKYSSQYTVYILLFLKLFKRFKLYGFRWPSSFRGAKYKANNQLNRLNRYIHGLGLQQKMGLTITLGL